MTSPSARLCKHCSLPAGVGNFHSFSCALRKTSSTTIREALNTLFFQNSGIDIDIDLSSSDGLCKTCYNRLGKLYSSFCKFQAVKKDDSGLSRLLGTGTGTMSLTTGDRHLTNWVPGAVHPFEERRSTQASTAKKPTTPISVNIKKIGRTQKGVQAISTFARRTIREEMRRITKSTVLKNQVDSSDDVNLWPILNAELVKTAPNTLHVLQAIAGKRLSVSSLHPMIGAAYCVLAISRSRIMNRFQKLIGLILCTTSASKDVFAFLNQVGFSVSYNASLACAKGLGSLHDENPMQGPEATETELQNDESGESVHVPERDSALTPTPAIPMRPNKSVGDPRVSRKKPRLGLDQN